MLRATGSFSGNFRCSAFDLAGRPKRKRGWHDISELLLLQHLKSWRKGQIGTTTGSDLPYLAIYRLLSFEKIELHLSFAWVSTVVKLKTRFLQRILALLAKGFAPHCFWFVFQNQNKRPGEWRSLDGGWYGGWVALPPGKMSIYLFVWARHATVTNKGYKLTWQKLHKTVRFFFGLFLTPLLSNLLYWSLSMFVANANTSALLPKQGLIAYMVCCLQKWSWPSMKQK